MRYPLISSDSIMVAALHHEGAGNHEVSHLSVVECAAHVEIGHLPFDAVHEAEAFVCGGDFAGPAIEVAGTDRKAVAFQDCRNADGGLAAVAKAIKRDPA